MSTNTRLLVTGEIVLGEGMDSFSNATVRVRLEDVTYQDVSSEVVAEQVIRGLSHDRGTERRISFALYGPEPDARADYSVSVHVDLQGDGQVQRGDYLSMQSYPVLTFGRPNWVSVRVRRVG